MPLKSSYLMVLLLVLSFFLVAAGPNVPSHLDRQKVKYGCTTCHVGFSLRTGGGSDRCINCHGSSSKVPIAPGIKLKNIEAEFHKTYRHPTFDVRGMHNSGETLPETDPRAPRHADCVDCHHPHFVSPENKFAGIRGKRVGNVIADITQEYELCYKCHAESANLPGRFTNKRAEFALTNPSFHPVEGEGKNLAVVSLLKPYREKKTTPSDISTIGCGDCHASDSADSPKGPHGSSYPYILVENYSTKDNQPESPFAYALCYRCHNRTSILGDESFRFHALHIKGKGATGADGTSCYTCHNSHGSSEHRYLIRFSMDVVSPNSQGLLKFAETGVSTFHGECYLSCHGVDHNPKSY
jgi:Zn finger protein HypA/HybF involved in hydrogenase expression